jgi:hypothetical protein
LNPFESFAQVLNKRKDPFVSPFETVEENTAVSKEEFKDLLAQIDKGLRALPATAQVCISLLDHMIMMVFA